MVKQWFQWFCVKNGNFIYADWFYDDQECAWLDIRGETIVLPLETTRREFIHSLRYKNVIFQATVDQFE